MFMTWEEAKEKFPGKWVIFRNPKYADEDIFHMNLLGGELVATASKMQEMEDAIPEDDGVYAVSHTWEDEAIGILKSGF
jgi:FAD synthase